MSEGQGEGCVCTPSHRLTARQLTLERLRAGEPGSLQRPCGALRLIVAGGYWNSGPGQDGRGTAVHGKFVTLPQTI